MSNDIGEFSSEILHDQALTIARLRAKCERLEGELQNEKTQHEIDNKGNNEWIESLCSQLCKMEDALGFKNDCYDKKGRWIPTIGPWLERLRDLLAAEGELGDLREERDKPANSLREVEAQCAEMRSALVEIAEAYANNEPISATWAKEALSTTCGKAIVERLKEARRLLVLFSDVYEWAHQLREDIASMPIEFQQSFPSQINLKSLRSALDSARAQHVDDRRDQWLAGGQP